MILQIEGFENLEQIKIFLNWYSGQGEQSAQEWFEVHGKDFKYVNIDDAKTFPVKEDNGIVKAVFKVI